MIYKISESEERNVDSNMTIKDLYRENGASFNCVIGNLDGIHGPMINSKSIKYYLIFNASATVIIDDVPYIVEKGDFVKIPVGSIHSIDGKVEFAIICNPPYDPSFEKKI